MSAVASFLTTYVSIFLCGAGWAFFVCARPTEAALAFIASIAATGIGRVL